MSDDKVEVGTFRIVHEDDSTRIIRGRVEGPIGYADEPGRSRPYVLIIHGFKGFMNWGFFPELSRRIAARGMVSVSFNMSGSGIGDDLENFSDLSGFQANTCSRELEDADSVRDLIRRGEFPGVHPERGSVFGHSWGGGVGILHVARHGDYRSLVTWASVCDVDLFGPGVRDLWRREGVLKIQNKRTGQELPVGVATLFDLEQNRERLNVLRACERLRCPVLLVHGSADESVPVAAMDRLASAIPDDLSETLKVPGAGHTFGATHPLQSISPELDRVLTATVDFFARHTLASS